MSRPILHPILLVAALIGLDYDAVPKAAAPAPPKPKGPEPPRQGFPKTEQHVVSGQAGGGTVVDLPRVDGRFEFSCVRDDCRYRRGFGTLKGAMGGISRHLLHVHRVQAVWRGL